MSYREKIERYLVNEFNGKIRPLTIDDNRLIDSHKNGSFGFSLCAFMLYSNGLNPKAVSEFAPMGLLYHDGDCIFSIGIFKKIKDSDEIFIHVISVLNFS